MRKVISMIHYECKMQLKRMATWGVLLAATVIALLDNFPSADNLARLEFLVQPAYFIYRTVSLDMLILVFGLMFLLSNRFPIDDKTGIKPLVMASPVRKGQYIAGKLFAAVAYTFTMLCIFLLLNTAIYCVAAPFEIDIADLVRIVLKTVLTSCIPVSIFIGFYSVAFPALMDLRLFYLLAAVLFALNAFHVGTAEAVPCYLITSGDLVRLIWVHPKWPQIDMGSVLANLVFLLGCSFTSWFLLLFKRRFWRAE